MAGNYAYQEKIEECSPKPTRLYAPGYGFPKSSKGLLPWSWAEQRLKIS